MKQIFFTRCYSSPLIKPRHLCKTSRHPGIPPDIRYKQRICMPNKQFLRIEAYRWGDLPNFKLVETNRSSRIAPPPIRTCAVLCLQTRPRTRKYKRRSDRRDNETLKGRRHDIAQRDPKRQQKFNLKSTPTKRLPLWFNHTRNFYQLHSGHYAIMFRYLVRYIRLMLLCVDLKSSYFKYFNRSTFLLSAMCPIYRVPLSVTKCETYTDTKNNTPISIECVMLKLKDM